MSEDSDYNKYAFFAVFLLLVYLFYLIAKPFLAYAIFGLIISISTHPIYDWLINATKSKGRAAALTILLSILIIIFPLTFLVTSIVGEIYSFFASTSLTSIQDIIVKVLERFNLDINLSSYLHEMISNLGKTLTSSTFKIIYSATDVAIGVLIMFTVIYYALTEGHAWLSSIEAFLPVESKRKKLLLEKIRQVTRTVIQVELLISLIQGILGGLAFYFAGIPNPFFWGFLMAILAFLPFVGTGLVWVPAAIIKITNGQIGVGIFILIYGILAIGGIDYTLRPKLVSKGGSIHPVTALIGAFGGLKLLGFAGLVIGPLVAAILEVFLRFHNEDYQDKINRKNSSKKN